MATYDYLNEQCTAARAADIIFRSVDTGKRWLQRLRKAKGYPPYFPVTIGEFCEYYHLSTSNLS